MDLMYNYSTKDIFGYERDVNSVVKANTDRVNKAFKHMKSNRSKGFSAMGLSCNNFTEWSFYYDLQSDVEADRITVIHNISFNEKDTQTMKYTDARKLALNVIGAK